MRIDPLPIPLAWSNQPKNEQRTNRSTHAKLSYDGRWMTVELGENGSCKTTAEQHPNPFQLLSAVLDQRQGSTMPDGRDAAPSAESSENPSAQAGAKESRESASRARSETENSLDDMENRRAADDTHAYVQDAPTVVAEAGLPQQMPADRAAQLDAANPFGSADRADHGQLRQVVSELLKRMRIQGSVATFSLDQVIDGFSRTTVSVSQGSGTVKLSIDCGSADETTWFKKHADSIRSRLSRRLKGNIDMQLNGESVDG